MVEQAKKKRGPGRPSKKQGLDPKTEKTKQAPDPVENSGTSDNLIGQGNRQLKGMAEICKYVRFSESTVLGWIRDANFPAKQTTTAGIWVTTTKKIDQWREIFFG